MMYSLDEIGLIPAVLSDVKHRGDVNPFVKSPFGGEKLPIFVSPMTCIVNANNICEFSRSKVEPILPVAGDYELRRQLPNGADWLGWTAVTMQEFSTLFNEDKAPNNRDYYILIDVANGHMDSLFTHIKDAKQKYGDKLTIMVGNIANPETYIECCKARVDYVRVGIGGGSGCTTSVQTGIHTSMPYILEGIKALKVSPLIFKTKVVADGGVSTISRAIKCLALGADYVMMGKCFAQCEEGGTYPQYVYDKEGNVRTEHLYYGQSSTQGQIDRFGNAKNNPEGTAYWVPVTTNLTEFTNKFEAALRSAMSYCNAQTLEDFIGKVKYEYMSPLEFNAFNK